MFYTFLLSTTVLYALVLQVNAVYNKDVVCVIDKGQAPMCKMEPSPSRRNILTNSKTPSHDPYIPRPHAIFYNCSSLQCEPIKLFSLTQVTSPDLHLKSCYLQPNAQFECEQIRYNHFKTVDKLLFLTANIENKTFYMVDCLVYEDGGRVCHRQNSNESHAPLVDTGTIARPKEPNVLSQDDFLCEETPQKIINCDIDPFVPYANGLKLKQSVKTDGDILLKTGEYVVIMRKNCFDSWCGYSGSVKPNRRSWFEKYEPPGGKTYLCYYAKRQQVCKVIKDKPIVQSWLESK